MKLRYGIATIATLGAMAWTASFAAPPTTSKGLLLVANKGDRTLGIIDPLAGKQIATVAEKAVTAHEVIASPDGKLAYVPIYGNAGVGKPGSDGSHMIVVDIAKRSIVGNVDFGKGLRPHCPMFGPKDGLLYVTTENENTISVVDPKTLKVVGTIPTGDEQTHMLAISNDGKRGYTSNVGPGTVSVLDMVNRKLITVIPVTDVAQRISVSADDKLAFTADQKTPRLAVIDTATNKVSGWIELPSIGYGTASTPDSKYLVVALPKADKVGIVDIKARKVIKTIDVPATPQMALMQPDGKIAYVSCDVDGKIVAIRTSDWEVDKIIEAGAYADGLAWAPSK